MLNDYGFFICFWRSFIRITAKNGQNISIFGCNLMHFRYVSIVFDQLILMFSCFFYWTNKMQFQVNKLCFSQKISRFSIDLESSKYTVFKLHKAIVSGSSSGGCVTAFCGKISANCNKSCNPGIRNATVCWPKFKMIQ